MSPVPARTVPPPDREDALVRAVDGPLDVIVVGGGITGAGVALDAATRGLRVALVERDDLASGTSSRSSKMVHGGIRYLATGDLAMVAEGVRERDRLRRLAPHLVRPLRFVVPVAHRRARAELRVGLALYDVVARGRGVARHARLTREEVAAVAPTLARGHEAGGFRYVDAATDDARLTLTVALTARRHGALIVNHAEVVSLLGDERRVVGVEVRDRLGGDRVELHAPWVVSAGGVWTDAVRDLAPHAADHRVLPAKGVHLVLDRDRLPVSEAVVVPSAAGDGRRVFVVPWGRQVYVGTTDERYEGPLDRAAVTDAEADYLLAAVGRSFAVALTPRDAVGAWAGLRPLASPAVGVASRDLSRRHAIREEPAGLVSVTGGKLTTYRQMAEEVVDRIVAGRGPRPSLTRDVPLGITRPLGASVAATLETGRAVGVDEPTAAAVHDRHGDLAPAVLRFCADHDGVAPLVASLGGSDGPLVGEVRWGVRHELARTVADVLCRRTTVALRDRAAGGGVADAVAAVLGEELGLDATERDRQVDQHLTAVARERGPVGLSPGAHRRSPGR